MSDPCAWVGSDVASPGHHPPVVAWTARRIDAGVVWINHYNDVPAGQPFGGYNQSGTGRENALETIDECTRTKAINVNLG